MKKWKLLSSKSVLESKWLNVFINDYELPNGQITRNYYHVQKQDCVVVIAEKEGLLGVIRQYRRGIDEVIYELPAGLIENGESIIDTALSELAEETGFTGDATVLTSTWTQPAFISMKTNFVFVEITEFVGTDLGFDEEIEFEFMSHSRINDLIHCGEITDLSFIAGMYLYGQHLARR